MADAIPSWQVVGVNRTDRLYAIVEVLRATAPRARTARQLAERFEVSARTIERDISALQQSGVPIWATPGPGGGYSVDPEMTLPPLNLTADEDRKSTRLNSSHTVISYAVFCLKK